MQIYHNLGECLKFVHTKSRAAMSSLVLCRHCREKFMGLGMDLALPGRQNKWGPLFVSANERARGTCSILNAFYIYSFFFFVVFFLVVCFRGWLLTNEK